MKKGDIVLLPFPFTNLQGKKRRPAVVLYVGDFDIIVSFITTQLRFEDKTDVYLEPSKKNRLKKHSLIKANKLATLDISLVIGKIGELDAEIVKKLDTNLKKVLGLE